MPVGCLVGVGVVALPTLFALRRRLPLARILLLPPSRRRRDVERVADIPYGAAGRRNLIDLEKVIAWVRAHGPEYGADPG